MRRLVGIVVQSIFLLSVSFVALTSSAEKNHQEKALVCFLARSVVVRSTWAGNQDIYLVELCTESSPSALVEFVDEYSVFGVSASPSLLASEEFESVGIQRTPECDVPFRPMPIRAAASDNIVIPPIEQSSTWNHQFRKKKIQFCPTVAERDSRYLDLN